MLRACGETQCSLLRSFVFYHLLQDGFIRVSGDVQVLVPVVF